MANEKFDISNVNEKNIVATAESCITDLAGGKKFLQALIMQAFVYIVNSGSNNCLYVTAMRNRFVKHGDDVAAELALFEAYIEDRTNLVLAEDKIGQMIYKVDGDKLIQDMTVTRNWYQKAPKLASEKPLKGTSEAIAELFKLAGSKKFNAEAQAYMTWIAQSADSEATKIAYYTAKNEQSLTEKIAEDMEANATVFQENQDRADSKTNAH